MTYASPYSIILGETVINRDSYSTYLWNAAVYESLYVRNSSNNFDWELRLADSFPNVSLDGLTITVTLKQNLIFSNGNILDANDVVYSLNLLKGQSSYSILSKMASASVVDSNTIQILLNEKYVFYLDLLGIPILDQESGTSNPMGSGPFVLDQLNSNITHVVLIKNSNYNFGTVKVDKLIFSYIATSSAALSGLANGEIDIVDSGYAVDQSTYESIIGVNVESVHRLNHFEFGLNHIHPYFGTGELIPDTGITTDDYQQSLLVRKAMSHVTNRQNIVENIRNGRADLATSPVPVISTLHDSSIQPRNYSVQAARNLMTDAGFDYSSLGGENVDMTFNNSFFDVTILSANTNPDRNQFASQYANELKKIGIGTTLISTGWSVVVPRTFGQTGPNLVPLYGDGGFDIYAGSYGWGFDFIGSDAYSAEGSCVTGNCDNFYNFDVYGNQTEITNLSRDILDELDYDIRKNLAKDLQLEFYNNLPVLPLYHEKEFAGYSNRVSGFNVTAIYNLVADWSQLESSFNFIPPTSSSSTITTTGSPTTSTSSGTTTTSSGEFSPTTSVSTSLTQSSSSNTETDSENSDDAGLNIKFASVVTSIILISIIPRYIFMRRKS
ncbi:MAG: ABC transporter substrate-binding protein [Candidatus Heimdallarchaeota archaeon]|nr:ABC transporter substrate-binding protein [Candidatus Heimdallarchaeota archaeon]